MDPTAIIEEIDALGFTGKEIEEAEALAEPETQEPPEKSVLIEQLLGQARRENKPLGDRGPRTVKVRGGEGPLHSRLGLVRAAQP